MKTTLLTSPAKINLTLKVLNYDKLLSKHKISSKVYLLKLSDTIKVSKSKNLSIKYYINKKKIIVQNDIIKKTILYFDKKYGTNSKFEISINKMIPIGYGLGGGFSGAGFNKGTLLSKASPVYATKIVGIHKVLPKTKAGEVGSQAV